MKYCSILAASLAATATAHSIAVAAQQQVVLSNDPTQYLIELGPEETRWVTEDEKWALRRVRGFSV